MKFYVNYLKTEDKTSVAKECDSWKKAKAFYNLLLFAGTNSIADLNYEITITDEKGKCWEHSKNHLEHIFNKDGYFKFRNKNGTPMWRIDDNKTRNALFDEDGRAIYDMTEVKKFIKDNNCDIDSDIVIYYHCNMIPRSTKGMWPASEAFN